MGAHKPFAAVSSVLLWQQNLNKLGFLPYKPFFDSNTVHKLRFQFAPVHFSADAGLGKFKQKQNVSMFAIAIRRQGGENTKQLFGGVTRHVNTVLMVTLDKIRKEVSAWVASSVTSRRLGWDRWYCLSPKAKGPYAYLGFGENKQELQSKIPSLI